MNRTDISDLLYKSIVDNREYIENQYQLSKNSIGYFYIDDVFPLEFAKTIFEKFPKTSEAVKKKNLREYKYTAYQMNKYDALLEEVIYAFQDKKIVDLIGEICGLKSVYADESLYAGGLSLMEKDNFLNPHLDNSHDKNLNNWRVLNLLYYVTPNWELQNGGNLELWPNGLSEKPLTIVSKFNRLVVMTTHQKSWHSVSKVLKNDVRCCVSNYYFSDFPVFNSDQFHVTTFRGRPTEKMIDFLLRIDNNLRTGLRKLFKKGIRENPHQYKK